MKGTEEIFSICLTLLSKGYIKFISKKGLFWYIFLTLITHSPIFYLTRHLAQAYIFNGGDFWHKSPLIPRFTNGIRSLKPFIKWIQISNYLEYNN